MLLLYPFFPRTTKLTDEKKQDLPMILLPQKALCVNAVLLQQPRPAGKLILHAGRNLLTKSLPVISQMPLLASRLRMRALAAWLQA